MKLLVVSVGSPRDPALAEAILDYERRVSRYFRLETIEVRAAAGHGGDPDAARAREGRAMVRRIPEELEAWALTRSGRMFSSRELAALLADAATYSRPGIAFLLGGAFGIAPEVVSRCRRQVSLSRLTLPHELARLVLAEQLYRAGTILRGEPYHKGA